MRSISECLSFAERYCEIEWHDFTGHIQGVYYRDDGQAVIGLADRLTPYEDRLRSVIAEELGHHFTSGTGDWVPPMFSYADRIDLGRIEAKAMRWAANWLIDDATFVDAAAFVATMECPDERGELAELLGVTREVIDAKFRLLEARGLI